MKRTKKILCALLAVLMCVSTFSFAASAVRAGEVEVGDTFAFGMYPTSLVTDRELVTQLNSAKRDNKGDVIIGSTVYRAVKPDVPSVYTDVDYKTQYLIGVLYEEYKEYLESYGYNTESTYWFEYEPIEWRVLSKSADRVVLMTEKVVDTSAFNGLLEIANQKDVSWKNSDVRKWLNDSFYNTAFSDAEKKYVLPSSLKNEDNPIASIYNVPGSHSYGHAVYYTKGIAGEDTKDFVYLPSFADITNRAYGFNQGWPVNNGDHGEDTGYYMEDPARQVTSTDFAKSHGVWSELRKDAENIEYYGLCRYWLRTPGLNLYYNASVLEDGRVSVQGFQSNHHILGIRPMIQVSPSAIQNAIRLSAPDGTVRYRQKGVHIDSNLDVEWASSNPDIAEIDADGNITIKDVGTVIFTATYEDEDGNITTATAKLEITYTWWQQAIRYFLFGWLWY